MRTEIVRISTTLAAWNRSRESRIVFQMPTLAALLPQYQRQPCLLRMHPVLRLVEHHRLRPLDHLRRHLLAPVRRQVVHEQRLRRRQRHHPRVHLVPLARTSVEPPSAPRTASLGSRRQAREPPEARAISSARATVSAGSSYPAGEPTRNPTPLIAAARHSDRATLFPSPMNARLTPASRPFFSSTVSTSASAWQGCSPSDSAVMTGTSAQRARCSTVCCSNVRAAIPS